ncbi:MAG: phosphomannomutase/phosphoglucomutase [Acidobacteriota bacterium]|nr:phosphomannomutase/phosphoglucomutase [Acidobacteriota bacterium]
MEIKISKDIFREYDIRGVVGQDLDQNIAVLIGRAVAAKIQKVGLNKMAVGRDCRLSSPELLAGLTEGLLSSGVQVIDLGIVPTPLVYFTSYYFREEAAMVITGSHNPPEFNGFKIMIGEDTLHGEEILDIYRIIKEGAFIATVQRGQLTAFDPVPDYLNYVTSQLHLNRPVKVVLDAGNGTAGPVAVSLFKKLGAEVIELYTEMDGRFPHHHPDPTLPDALKDLVARVKETGAEAGLAYDGDGDRLGAIDETGKIIWGDQLMIIFARDLLPSHPGAAIISEVKASHLLYDEISRLGGRPVMWKAGHSLIKEKIKQEKALLAGEMSGHLFFADRWFGFDDAIYASARLVEIISRQKKKLSAYLADLPPVYNTPEIRIYASDEVKFKVVDLVKAELRRQPEVKKIIDIDGVRAVFDHGWGLVRASNTQPVLVLRFEADSQEELNRIEKKVKSCLEEVLKNLNYK